MTAISPLSSDSDSLKSTSPRSLADDSWQGTYPSIKYTKAVTNRTVRRTKWLVSLKYLGDIYKPMSEAQSITGEQSIARELTAFQNNILVILANEPMYGLAIKRELESYYGTEVNHGRLYPNLDELVDLGLVEKSELDKRTNQYALTDDGYDAVLDGIQWTLSNVVTNDDRADEINDIVEDSY